MSFSVPPYTPAKSASFQQSSRTTELLFTIAVLIRNSLDDNDDSGDGDDGDDDE